MLYYSVTVGILQSSWQVLKPRFYKALSYFIFHTLFSLKASRFFFKFRSSGWKSLFYRKYVDEVITLSQMHMTSMFGLKVINLLRGSVEVTRIRTCDVTVVFEV